MTYVKFSEWCLANIHPSPHPSSVHSSIHPFILLNSPLNHPSISPLIYSSDHSFIHCFALLFIICLFIYHLFINVSSIHSTIRTSICSSIRAYIIHPSIIHYSHIYSCIPLLTILHPSIYVSTSCVHIVIFSPSINHCSSSHPCIQLLTILHPSIHIQPSFHLSIQFIQSPFHSSISLPVLSFLPSVTHSSLQQLYAEFLLHVWHQSSYKTTKTCKVPALMRRHTLHKCKRGNCSHGWVKKIKHSDVLKDHALSYGWSVGKCTFQLSPQWGGKQPCLELGKTILGRGNHRCHRKAATSHSPCLCLWMHGHHLSPADHSIQPPPGAWRQWVGRKEVHWIIQFVI